MEGFIQRFVGDDKNHACDVAKEGRILLRERKIFVS